MKEKHNKWTEEKYKNSAEGSGHTSSVASPRQSIKGTTQKYATSLPLNSFVAEYGEYVHGQTGDLILPSWILGMGVHSDIFTTLTLVGFYFLNNCTAWSVFRGFHENDESLISTKQQLWGNKVIHFEPVHSWVARDNRNRKQKQEARVKMAIWNSTVFKIAACNEKEFLMPQSLITFMCQILQQIHITLKWLMVQQFPNIGICFIQYTAAIIFAGIMCCLAVIIYNPFIHRGYTNAYFFPWD